MGPHALRPWGTLIPHWFYKGPRAELRVRSLGIQQHHFPLRDATLCVLLVSPMVSHDFWVTVFGGYFLAQQNLLKPLVFIRFLKGFGALAIFGPLYCRWSVKGKLFSCYMVRQKSQVGVCGLVVLGG